MNQKRNYFTLRISGTSPRCIDKAGGPLYLPAFSTPSGEREIIMRMAVPPIRERRQIYRLLSEFFREYKVSRFNKAIGELCRFYRLKRPRIEWFEYLDWGRTAGRTFENGTIYLVHPENWKLGRKYNSEQQWINTVFHEMGHYVLWTDAEAKADIFAAEMERSVARRPPRAAGGRSAGRRAA